MRWQSGWPPIRRRPRSSAPAISFCCRFFPPATRFCSLERITRSMREGGECCAAMTAAVQPPWGWCAPAPSGFTVVCNPARTAQPSFEERSGNFLQLQVAVAALDRPLGDSDAVIKQALAGRPEILVERKERIRLQLAKRASQDFLNLIYPVEEIAFFDLQHAAAQLPVGAQEIVNPEQPMILLLQRTAAYAAEIRQVFFDFAAIITLADGSAGPFQAHGAHMFFHARALAEAGVTGLEDGPENAATRVFFSRATPAEYA